MLKIKDIKLKPGQEKDLTGAACRALKIPRERVLEVKLLRSNLDTRRRDDIKYVMTLGVTVQNERELLLRRKNDKSLSVWEAPPLPEPLRPDFLPDIPPVIVGAGPAGLFAALTLCRAGVRCILLERGRDVDSRAGDVDRLNTEGILNPESNIQFGEGGAGAFSDGKLHTGTKSPYLRTVLQELADAGAPESILYEAEPHVGTDMLRIACRNLRSRLTQMGCDIRYGHRLTDIRLTEERVSAVTVLGEGEYTLPCSQLILAPGQSSTELYELLYEKGVRMQKKPFSLGVRIEHKQEELDKDRYGSFYPLKLPHSSYKLVEHLPNGRSVYSFCVCPGGQVIASQNQEGTVVTNGMSAYARDKENINGAILVTVSPEDLPEHPLSGLYWRQRIEQAAGQAGGGGNIAPAQLVGDFLQNRPSTAPGHITPSYQPGVRLCDLADILPDFVTDSLRQALPLFARRQRIFGDGDAVMTAVESRSSSPVQMLRQEDMTCTYGGLRICGEGAGWAGGIMSSAVDGIKCANALLREFTYQ